ncbi:hypothetical protein DY467_22580 [Rhodopseudomonas sp. BR0G17]|nr:hypothetical protein [Rhodopseudomonas sp. BR0G17]
MCDPHQAVDDETSTANYRCCMTVLLQTPGRGLRRTVADRRDGARPIVAFDDKVAATPPRFVLIHIAQIFA